MEPGDPRVQRSDPDPTREAASGAGSEERQASGAGLLFDLVPLLLFFAAFRLYGVLVATAVLVAATLGQVAWLRFTGKPVPTFLWVILGITSVTGTATLISGDARFIKLKPTAVYWSIVLVLAGGRLLFGRNLVHAALGERLRLPERGWDLLQRNACIFFLGMGAANLYVAHAFSTEAWVSFKVIWCTALTFLFAISQALLIERALRKEPGR